MPTANGTDILLNISDTLVESMPDVSEHAITEHEAQQALNNRANDDAVIPTAHKPANAPVDKSKWPVDKFDNRYNPETHTVSPLTGKVIKKRRGGGNKTANAQSSVVTPKGNSTSAADTANAELVANATATGQFAAAATVSICVGIFGDEFHPRKAADAGYDEMEYLQGAFAAYFLATGKTDIPPGMALAIALCSYGLPRVTMPKTRSRLSAIKDWFGSKFLAWRGKKTLRSADKQAENSARDQH